MQGASPDGSFDEGAWRDAVQRLRAGEPVLPAEALRRYAEALASSAAPGDLTAPWRRALVASTMRRRATGGRLAALLLDTSLCTVDDLARCLDLHLDAPPAPQTALAFDLSDTRFVVFERAPLDALAALSSRLAAMIDPGGRELSDPSQARLAERLARAGDLDGAATALRRIAWHGDLAAALVDVWPRLSDALRDEFAERLGRAVTHSGLAPVHHVRYLCDLATWTRDVARLDAAEAAVRALSPGELEVSPDHPHPLEDLADAFAAFDRWSDAHAILAELDPADRWSALVRLLPRAKDPALRASLRDDAVDLADDYDLSRLLERAPEAWPDVLERLDAIDDPDARFDAMCDVAPRLPSASSRALCARLVDAMTHDPQHPTTPVGAERWASLLTALTSASCEDLLSPSQRAALVDALLAAPTDDLWREVVPFVPDDRLDAVLARTSSGLARATHYLDRDEAMSVGLALLPRLDEARRDAFLAFAREHAPRVCWDRLPDESLRAWPDDDARAIVAERLRIHQREFLDVRERARWHRLCDDAASYPCAPDESALHDALETAGEDDAAALRALARTWAIGGSEAVERVRADVDALLGA